MVSLIARYLTVAYIFESHFTAPDDFLSTNTQLFFQPDGIHVQCVNITIVSDSILENNESFLANLTTDDAAVILSPSMATLAILNDDSKHVYTYMGHVYLTKTRRVYRC